MYAHTHATTKYALMDTRTERLAQFIIDPTLCGPEVIQDEHVLTLAGEGNATWLVDSAEVAEAARINDTDWKYAHHDTPSHHERWRSADYVVVAITVTTEIKQVEI